MLKRNKVTKIDQANKVGANALSMFHDAHTQLEDAINLASEAANEHANIAAEHSAKHQEALATAERHRNVQKKISNFLNK